MAEYIDREAVFVLIRYNWDKICASIIEDVEKIPANDVSAVIHAKWIWYDSRAPQCGHCGMWAPFARYRKGQGTNERDLTDYCPSCGAKMAREGQSK